MDVGSFKHQTNDRKRRRTVHVFNITHNNIIVKVHDHQETFCPDLAGSSISKSTTSSVSAARPIPIIARSPVSLVTDEHRGMFTAVK